MKVKVWNNDRGFLEEHLAGKKRIMTYGAGAWANEIKKMLEANGFQLDYAIVDDAYYMKNRCMDKQGGGTGTRIISMGELIPPYDSKEDALIWAIGSPDKLRRCMKDEQGPAACFLIWDLGFWEDPDFASMHSDEFREACEMLCDDDSKKVFWSYVKAIGGDIEDDIFYSIGGTYFNELTRKKRPGAFLDCGSYDGQSALDYMNFIGGECRVYAFEPDRHNYQKLVKGMKDRPDVICLNKGCYSSEGLLSFCSNADMSSSLQENGAELVGVTTIDQTLGDNKAAFIKMDIEGAELEALKGARKVIERDMPVLAISAYHRQEDLITLIPYISRLCNEKEYYRLYLRHHSVVQAELVLYAVPAPRSAPTI